MLQHNKKGEKSQPNTFVDGVHVKISEDYKPPRRVVLPVSCQNCCPGEVLFSSYDFRLEESILSKLEEWRRARKEELERRKERLKTADKVCEEIEHFRNVTIGPSPVECGENTQASINHKLTDSVLTPVCAKQNSPSHKPASTKFNLSDFESDNSSPFDSMELKTINDMEALASILSTNNSGQSFLKINNNNNVDKDLGKTRLFVNNKNNEWGYAPLNGYNDIVYCNSEYNHTVEPSPHKNFNQYGLCPISENFQISNYGLNDFSNQFGAAVSPDRPSAHAEPPQPNALEKNKSCLMRSQEESFKKVPYILDELKEEIRSSRKREEEMARRSKLAYLKQSILFSSIKDRKQLPESSRNINRDKALSKLPDPTPSLSPSSQNLVCYIADLGFPPPRVARACGMFDDDYKKIIEFLLQVQSLEEKNYPGDLVEKALVLHQFKLTESLKFLEGMVVLLDLGFDEERAEEALMATNGDRDKALDMLIS